MYINTSIKETNKRRKRRGIMYKWICTTILAVVFLASFSMQTLAKEDEITSISIEVALRENGSAEVTETWEIKGVSGGTEYYKKVEDMGDKTITSLQVWDETGQQYETLDVWDVDLSLEEKAYKCGIIKNGDSYEICWGMNSYADHTYTISYTLEGLVKNYTDYAGFTYQFISKGMSSAPIFAEVIVYMEDVVLSTDNTRIWGLGYEGNIEFRENGSILAIAENGLDDRDNLSVMCRFENALFPLAQTDNGTFEAIQEKALEEGGSSTFAIVMILVVVAVIVIGVCILGYYLMKVKLADGTKVNIPSWKKVEVRSGLPFGGSLSASYMATYELKQGIQIGAVIGAYLIMWESKKYIKIDEVKDKVKDKKQSAIIFLKTSPKLNEAEAELYKILFQVANNEQVLSESRFKKWAEKNYKSFTDWEAKLREFGAQELVSMGRMEYTGNKIPRFNQRGMDEAVAMLGLKRYLKEYSAYYESMGSDTDLWSDYLAFSSLFGFSEKFVKALELSDPAYFDTYSNSFGYSTFGMMHMITMSNHISNAASASISTADGGGGSAMSGGGGFSGGGGGGSR